MNFSTKRVVTVFAIVFLLATHASFAAGQRLGGAAGIALPLGVLADTRGLGYHALAFVSTSGGLLRLEFGTAMFPGGEGSVESPRQHGDWRSVSAAVSVRPSLYSTERSRVRAHIGVSGHRLSIPNVSNPYGTVPGAQFGIGHEVRRGRMILSADLGLHTVLSDFGLIDFHTAHFIPVTLGVSW